MNAKEVEEKEEFIKWFSELNKDSIEVVGGKGANLGEIYNLGIPVPPGFVITTKAYNYFIEKSGLKYKISELLKSIDYDNTSKLNEISKNIRELIVSAKIPKELIEEIEEAYENLDVEDNKDEEGDVLEILKKENEAPFVAVRSSATTEDLADASFAGQQDSFLNIRGKEELLDTVKKCFASLFTSRATFYRNKKGFEHEKSGLAVVIQKMVHSEKSGVIFSKDPSFKNENIIIEAVYGLGEGIVSGRITPDSYTVSKDFEILNKEISDKKIAIVKNDEGKKEEISLSKEKSNSQVLSDYELNKLSEIAIKLEEHYKKPQDIEFAIEGEGVYIVQTRAITTIEQRVDLDGKEIEGEVILKGVGASPGISSGKIKIVKDLEEMDKVKKGDVLVTKMTNPDMVVTMQRSAAIITDEGGLTSHASIVSREMGIPAIVGTREATIKLKDGEVVTVDGSSGKVYKGKVAETEKKEIRLVQSKTKTKIKVMVDLPSYSERAAKTGLKSVGLTRIEGIIAESNKHPYSFLKDNKEKDYEEIIYKGISEIGKYFDELWIRTSDIRSDEFANLEGAPDVKEANPMLGFHGIRFSLKYPKILKAEFNALKRVFKEGKKIGIILPQVISVKEVQKVKEILKEIDFNDVRIGVMIETPASVQIIDKLCEEGIDFVSFGTNDLTQYTLAIDRGNEKVQEIYDDLDISVLRQIKHVINVCKNNGVETSICGQAGSKKEMVKFLVKNGIDSISVNADVASDIAEFVSGLEEGRDSSDEDILSKEEKIEPEKIENPQEIEESKEIEKSEETEMTNEEIDESEKKNEDEINKEDVTENVDEGVNEEKAEEKIEKNIEKGVEEGKEENNDLIKEETNEKENLEEEKLNDNETEEIIKENREENVEKEVEKNNEEVTDENSEENNEEDVKENVEKDKEDDAKKESEKDASEEDMNEEEDEENINADVEGDNNKKSEEDKEFLDIF